HGVGRAREPEADRARRGRDAPKAHRDRGAARHGAALRRQGLPRRLGQVEARLDARRAAAAAARLRMKRRLEHEPAYVLHAYAYKETSLVIEAFSRRLGRVGLLARGARRPRSAMRGVLLAFHPLRLTWTASAELGTLVSAEWSGGQGALAGTGLMC